MTALSTDGRRFGARNVAIVVAITGALAALGLAAVHTWGPHREEPITAVRTSTESQEELDAYWTRDRIEHATADPMFLHDVKHGPGAREVAIAVTAAGMMIAAGTAAARARKRRTAPRPRLSSPPR